MKSLTILLIITVMTIFGDYLIKLASLSTKGTTSWTFVIGMALYGLPAFGWFYLMRSHSLAVVAVFYSAVTIILMTALGVVIFKEAVGWREGMGITLALGSILVISQGS